MSHEYEARLAPTDGLHANGAARSAAARLETAFAAPPHAARLARAVQRTRQWLLDRQQADGYWVAELEGDTILESEYVLLLAYAGRLHSPRAAKAAQYIFDRQLPTGGWAIYPGGQAEISASVKAYFALKLAGYDASSAELQRARNAILDLGGADAVNSFTRFYLALLGQIGYEHCPAVPPEMVLLPKWFPINLYKISAWSRTILVPLAIMSACQPVRPLPAQQGIGELFLKRPHEWPPLRCPGHPQHPGLVSWDTFFRLVDNTTKFLSRRGWLPWRQRAIAAAEAWMRERFAGSDGLGAIFPPIVWSIIALGCLGYADDSPEVQECWRHLEGLVIEDRSSVRLQPCHSPVWDTALTLRALSAGGVPAGDDAVSRGVDWLLQKQLATPGDWSATVEAEPGGWAFEHANRCYPDVDDTAMCLMALRRQFADPTVPGDRGGPWLASGRAPGVAHARQQASRLAGVAAAIDRGTAWVLAMQNRDGGWGAFDRDNDRRFLCHVPYADHNAMIDPSSPDLAGRVLEMLGHCGRRLGDRAVDRAVTYLRRAQEADGSWFGRWGVNYIYGTWQVLAGLAAVGVPQDDPALVAGANWLGSYQQPSGGWGESPDSYARPELRGRGPVTASQTAWAVLGLIAGGRASSPAVARGVRYLVETQRADGTWHETQYTGTGFPQVFYLRYHYYPIYFPLLALAQYAGATGVQVG